MPNPFPIPVNYALCVSDGLERGKLTGKARTKFVATIAASIFGYKKKPSKAELQEVVKQIVEKYPSVGATSDNMVNNNYNYVHTMLVQKCVLYKW